MYKLIIVICYTGIIRYENRYSRKVNKSWIRILTIFSPYRDARRINHTCILLARNILHYLTPSKIAIHIRWKISRFDAPYRWRLPMYLGAPDRCVRYEIGRLSSRVPNQVMRDPPVPPSSHVSRAPVLWESSDFHQRMIAIMWVDLEETNGGVDGDDYILFAFTHVRHPAKCILWHNNGPQTFVKCARRER